MPNAEIKNNNKKKINTPGSKSYGKGEKVAGDRGRPGQRCHTRPDEASCMNIHVLPTPRKVEVSTGVAVNNPLLSISSLRSDQSCLKYEGKKNKKKIKRYLGSIYPTEYFSYTIKALFFSNAQPIISEKVAGIVGKG